MAKKFGLIGEKLGHSFSPAIHNMLGSYDYALYEIPRGGLADFIEHTELDGFNVTIPYKTDVIPFCTELSERAQAIGSVNTVIRRPDGTLYGDNTDYYGFEYLLTSGCKSAKGKKSIVLGSGGASKTVCAVMRAHGADVTVISRSGPDNYRNLDRHFDADIIVNTTPLGMYPNNGFSPISVSDFKKCSLVLDVVYNPEKTEIILQAEEAGITAISGLRMLVAQAKMAAELFTGNAIPDSENERIFRVVSHRMKNIVLIGMPGCGKTTVGRELARKTGRKLVDLDDVIIENAGRSIPEIFARDGEAAFRKLETEALADSAKNSGIIISTGGGIVTSPQNKRLMRQNSTVVFLERELSALPVSGRPVSLSRGIEQIFNERLPLYTSWGDIRIKNDKTPSDAADRIIKELEL